VHAALGANVGGVVVEAVQRLIDEYKARPEDMRVAIGAAAGHVVIEVGSEVIEAFASRFHYANDLFHSHPRRTCAD